MIDIDNKQQIKGVFHCFKAINLILVILDIIYAATVIYDDLGDDFIEWTLTFHAVVLLPSVLFHSLPKIRGTLGFQTFALVINILAIGAAIFNYIKLVNAEEPIDIAILLGLFMAFTLPGAILAISLTLALIFVPQHHQGEKYILVNQEFLGHQQAMI